MRCHGGISGTDTAVGLEIKPQCPKKERQRKTTCPENIVTRCLCSRQQQGASILAQRDISTTYNQQCNTAHPKQQCIRLSRSLSLSGGKGAATVESSSLSLEPLEDTRSFELDRTQPVFHAPRERERGEPSPGYSRMEIQSVL